LLRLLLAAGRRLLQGIGELPKLAGQVRESPGVPPLPIALPAFRRTVTCRQEVGGAGQGQEIHSFCGFALLPNDFTARTDKIIPYHSESIPNAPASTCSTPFHNGRWRTARGLFRLSPRGKT